MLISVAQARNALAFVPFARALRAPCREACRHARDIASSLALRHAHRFEHRDVNPRNVRLTAQGRAKLIDFGALAPFGPSTDVVGTPPLYVTPEVLYCQPLDQRAGGALWTQICVFFS